MSDLKKGASSLSLALVKPATYEIRIDKINLTDFDLNDHGNSLRIDSAFGDRMRYSNDFKKWLIFDGQRWLKDDVQQARQLAKEVMLECLKQAITLPRTEEAKKVESFAKFSLNCSMITHALAMLQSERFVRLSELDSDPHLLNFQNCTVDLRTGESRPHSADDFITKLVHHRYDPEAGCSRWRKFLKRIFNSNAALIDYFQYALGYSLTGNTSEKAVFFCSGGGNNGKTTALSTIRDLISEYSGMVEINTLMTRVESNNTQADLADLRGARFVTTSETESGQRLAEGKLKRITQGMGNIKSCRKYENPITFPETHKLWLDCNHLPLVRGTDDAIWNRLHLIPFDVTIPAAEIDRELPRKLLGEADGILAWLVAGAVRWHEQGLEKPPEVEAAGTRWRAESDTLLGFINDICVLSETAKSIASTLYAAYKSWCERNDERALTMRDFKAQLEQRGFQSKHTNTGNQYLGIGIVQPGQHGALRGQGAKE